MKINNMKNVIKKVLASVIILGAMSCVEGSKEQEVEVQSPEEVKEEKKEMPESADAEFKDGMVESIFQYYLKLRTALVASDAGGAKEAAENLGKDLTEKHGELKTLAQKISEAEDLEVQRKHFYQLTQKLEPIFRESINSGKVYKMHCPMAMDNAGAYWFSDAKEIRNPYFGDRMLKCGSIKDTLKANK